MIKRGELQPEFSSFYHFYLQKKYTDFFLLNLLDITEFLVNLLLFSEIVCIL